jgi:prepilin-type N-terminal cleavage/methylation domain-containing protein
MPALSRRTGGHGFTLVELVVAVALGTVVLGAVWQVLLASQRFFRLQSSVLEVQEGLRAAMQTLSAELRELDAAGGDILALAADSISIRATRGVEFMCAPPDPAAGRIVVRSSLSSGYREVDPARDRALVFRDGDPWTEDDDAWLDFGITSAGRAASCSDGAPATELRLLGSVRALDGVGPGAPVRWYERAVYRVYADETGTWWLGVRSYSGGAWAPLSPIAGPLRHPAGLQLDYSDASGAATAEPSRVATIALVVRGVASALLQATGGRQGHWADSLATVVAPRNGRR